MAKPVGKEARPLFSALSDTTYVCFTLRDWEGGEEMTLGLTDGCVMCAEALLFIKIFDKSGRTIFNDIYLIKSWWE